MLLFPFHFQNFSAPKIAVCLNNKNSRKYFRRDIALPQCKRQFSIPLLSKNEYFSPVYKFKFLNLTEFLTMIPVNRGLIIPGSDPKVLLIPIKIDA